MFIKKLNKIKIPIIRNNLSKDNRLSSLGNKEKINSKNGRSSGEEEELQNKARSKEQEEKER